MKNDGLSIIEAVMAIAILAIALASIVPAMTSYTSINSKQEVRTGAAIAAQQALDNLRQKKFDAWPESGSTQEIGADTNTYEVKMSYCAKGTSDCHTTDTARHVRLEVGHNDKLVYEVQTVYTRFD